MSKRMIRIFVEFIIAVLIVLFFSAFGQSGSFIKGIHDAYWLIVHTVRGEYIRANYAGVSAAAIWDSLRLIAIGTITSVALGLFYALFSYRLRSRWLYGLNEVIVEILQSLPEAMYVIVVFIVLVNLLKSGINLPGLFHDGLPRLQDTFAPALALALPGIFYLRRIIALRLLDEQDTQYVQTALSKGLSERRVFFRHVLPNILPTLYRQLPVVAGFVISNVLFAEFFLGYMALLFRVPAFAGWDMETGALGLKKPAGIPSFQPGALFISGAFLVTSWMLFSVLSEVLQLSVPREIKTVPGPGRRKIDIRWTLAGTLLIAAVFILSIFPHWFTTQNPGTEHLMNRSNMTFPPYPPGKAFPMGTDMIGRDLLSRTLSSTFPTLLYVVITTLLIVIGSILLATWLTVSQKPLMTRLVTWFSRILGAMPTLLILFLAMYIRNMHSSLQSLQYILWVALFEIGRGVIAFQGVMSEWFGFGFIEGAQSIGQSRFSILFRQLRSWFSQFTLEFTFTEFTRVLSLMTLLAMFHTYPVEQLLTSDTDKGLSVAPAQITWFSLLGDAANQVFNIVTYPFLIYAPVLFLLVTMLGASFIARGFRGKRKY